MARGKILLLHGALSNKSFSSFTLPSTLLDLTGHITRNSDYHSAYGGSADIWKGIWLKDTGTSNCKVRLDIQFVLDAILG
jgi:hypothetical protein